MKQIGIVGVGLVGNALADRLLAAGFEPIGFDRDPAAAQRFSARGLPCAQSLDALLDLTQTLILAVFDTGDVERIANVILASTRVPETFGLIDCSTGDPDRIAVLAERLRQSRIAYLEAPLSGSSEQIARGDAMLLIGADVADLARYSALLRAISPRQFVMGKPGMAARAKLATNLVLGLNRAVLAEGMVFAERMGIPRARFLELVLGTPARSDAALVKGQRMVDEHFEPPQSRIRQHLKDVELMLAAAAQRGQKLPLSETHANLMRAAMNAGDGELDNAAIIRQFARAHTNPNEDSSQRKPPDNPSRS